MKRIPALDSLRGVLLLLMTFNHLIWISGGSTFLQGFTLQPFGQFGAAEGFVFISGLLAGAIYSRPAHSNQELRQKAHHRALTIYGYHLVCLGVIVVWLALAYAFSPMAYGVLSANASGLVSDPLPALLLSVLLINKPFYLDILPLYVMFMLLLPLLIAAYRRGWMLLVVAVSVGCWLMSDWASDVMLVPLYAWMAPSLTVQTGFFDPIAWQLLFVLSSALGFACQNRTFRWQHPALTVLCVFIAGFIMAAQNGLFWDWGLKPQTLYQLGNKTELAWIRLLSLGVWVYLFAVVIQRFPRALVWHPLSYIGRYSLQVFSFQTVLIYLCAPMLFSLRAEGMYLPVVALCCASLWLPAWYLAARQQPDVKPILARNIKRGICAAGVCAVVVAMSVLPKNDVSELENLAHNTAEGHYPLMIQVNGVRDADAPVVVAVYAETDNLMGAASVHEQAYSPAQVSEGIMLEGLARGHYAVFVYQDSNGDQALTRDSNGMPKEGMGYSNNPILSGPPSMPQVKFAHTQAQRQTLRLAYFQ
ncbi:OpgC domain-containing protein [Photobacterium japonica]|uniref:OpgC domain-containing protein n=1 Tax=Photobacterium japonica TaxID=2910235 RepID=UPI003D14133C